LCESSETAFDPNHPYYDEKSTRDAPKWSVVHVEFRRKFPKLITLTELKSFAKPGGMLENLPLLKQTRLSVSKVTAKEWDFIMSIAKDDEHPDTEADASIPNGDPDLEHIDPNIEAPKDVHQHAQEQDEGPRPGEEVY
jgi:hypothetical protein